jgi:hypothetical protein
MVETVDNVFMGIIFVVGILLSVISIMADKSASNSPTCYTPKARTALRWILVFGVIFAVSSISFAVCQYKCGPCKGATLALEMYVGISLVLSLAITGLAITLNNELDATKCPDAAKMATGLIGMGVTSVAFCIGMVGNLGYDKYKKGWASRPPATQPTAPPPTISSDQQDNIFEDMNEMTARERKKQSKEHQDIFRNVQDAREVEFENQQERAYNQSRQDSVRQQRLDASAERARQKSESRNPARSSSPRDLFNAYSPSNDTPGDPRNYAMSSSPAYQNPPAGSAFKGKKKSKM